jgi:hypothetical protein
VQVISEIADANPALIVAAAAVLYGLAWWLRRNVRLALCLVALAFVVSMLALPGGRNAIDAAAALGKPMDRARCLAGAVLAGAPMDQRAAAQTRRCRPPVPSVHAPSAAGAHRAQRNATSLKEAFGD